MGSYWFLKNGRLQVLSRPTAPLCLLHSNLEHDQATELQRNLLPDPGAIPYSFCCKILGYSGFPPETMERGPEANFYRRYCSVPVPYQVPESYLSILRCHNGHLPIANTAYPILFYRRNVLANTIRVRQLVSTAKQFHTGLGSICLLTAAENSPQDQ